MRLLDFIFRKKEKTYNGFRYSATGIFGYIVKCRDDKVFQIDSPVFPNPDISIKCLSKDYILLNFDNDVTHLTAGVRRFIADSDGNNQGYYEYISANEFLIVTNDTTLYVKSLESGWDIFKSGKIVAKINKIPKSQRKIYYENGYEMEKCLIISISAEVSNDLYPYIMAIPMSGF